MYVQWDTLTMQILEKLWRLPENRHIKLVTTEAKRNYLVVEPNYHKTNICSDYLLAIEMKRTQILQLI